jgi:hypothetical protein
MTLFMDGSFFARLVGPMLDQLRRLANSTQGEHSIDDLKAEAWLAAREISEEQHGVVFAPEDERFQHAILARLTKAFGRFANRQMRFAVRLDRDQVGDDGNSRPNSLASTLAAPDRYEPQIAIERAEERVGHALRLARRFSEASAYLHVLDRFDGDRQAIADYLAIGRSLLDARLRRAEHLARCQPSIFDGITSVPPDFVPRRGHGRLRNASPRRRFQSMCAAMRPRQLNLFSRWANWFART